ncbi:MAG: hypothetical protein HPY55_12455 [Firmicutes bacterium]|nr:hypothetical protein [Bacillota bacterium]
MKRRFIQAVSVGKNTADQAITGDNNVNDMCPDMLRTEEYLRTAELMNESQRRSLSVILALLDEALFDFEAWADGRERRGIMYSETNDLSPAQREKVRRHVIALREEVDVLRSDLNLQMRTQSVRASIFARASSLWEGLVDSEPRRLRRYGEVNPEMEEYLAPRVKALVSRLEEIISCLRMGAK